MRAMKYLFGTVYVLVLVTQLPHIWSAYSALERPGFALAHVTALGAAVAFELATGVFTLRIVQGSRRRATRAGLAFFIVGSAVANAFYYRWLPFVFDVVMPIFATIALPVALALFAEEFGTELKRERTEANRAQRRSQPTPTDELAEEQPATPLAIAPEPQASALPFVCHVCARSYRTQQALAGHMSVHRNGNGAHHEPLSALSASAGNGDGIKAPGGS